jgi:hypothetical protein
VAKLSPLRAQRIASLYNTIIVGESMLRRLVEELDAKQITRQHYVEDRGAFEKSLLQAREALLNEFGIKVIG